MASTIFEAMGLFMPMAFLCVPSMFDSSRVRVPLTT
jgi:hypothetical protein